MFFIILHATTVLFFESFFMQQQPVLLGNMKWIILIVKGLSESAGTLAGEISDDGSCWNLFRLVCSIYSSIDLESWWTTIVKCAHLNQNFSY